MENESFDEDTGYEKVVSRKKRRWLKVTIVLVLILVVAGSIRYVMSYRQHTEITNSVPLSVRQSIQFPIYIPSQKEYKPDSSSFNHSSEVLLFQIKNGSVDLAVSEQKKPTDFELSKFASSQDIIGADNFDIAQGKVLIGSVHGRQTFILVTNATILTGVAISQTSTDQLKLILRHLSTINPVQ